MEAAGSVPVVCRCGASDAPAVAQVQVASWRAAYRELLPAALLDDLCVAVAARRWEATIDAGELEVAIATVDGEPAGFVAWRVSDTVAEVAALYCIPQRWGTGVGAALLDEALTAAAGVGATDAVLWVLAGNARAEAFYRRAGFTPDGGARLAARGDQLCVDVRMRR